MTGHSEFSWHRFLACSVTKKGKLLACLSPVKHQSLSLVLAAG
jgi:hypothetical protein